jgi:hypothetical protein
VRLAPSAATRQARTDQLRRDRAASQVLRDALPTVQQLRLELKFEGPNASIPTPQSHVLFPPARAFFEYPCPYSDCDGQFDLNEAVKVAVARAPRRAQGTLVCEGTRGGDHTTGRPCQLKLVYEVSVTVQQSN